MKTLQGMMKMMKVKNSRRRLEREWYTLAVVLDRAASILYLVYFIIELTVSGHDSYRCINMLFAWHQDEDSNGISHSLVWINHFLAKRNKITQANFNFEVGLRCKLLRSDSRYLVRIPNALDNIFLIKVPPIICAYVNAGFSKDSQKIMMTTNHLQ